jgi:hypothetical protein
MTKGEYFMSENDCLNPEEHCELHMCQMKSTETSAEINKLYENPKFVCTNCGVKVNREENLCSPKPI